MKKWDTERWNEDTATLECPHCGRVSFGEEPRIMTPCLLCSTEVIIDPTTGQRTITIKSGENYE